MSIPEHLWIVAEKQARRSCIRRYRTGAVLFDRDFNIVGRGCSYVRLRGRGSHAEETALGMMRDQAVGCLIVTLTKRDRYAGSSRPCAHCIHLLNNAGIEYVVYMERLNDGSWVENVETLESLVERAEGIEISTYGNKMYVA